MPRLLGGVLAGCALVLVSVASFPAADAQVPIPTEPERQFVDFALVTIRGYAETDWLVPAELKIIVKDLSRDSAQGGNVPAGGAPVAPISHQVVLSVIEMIPPANQSGWHYVLENLRDIKGGSEVEMSVRLTPTAAVKSQTVTLRIQGTYTGPNGITQVQNTSVTARVRPFSNMQVSIADPIQQAGQFEVVQYGVRITNQGVYPEGYRIAASSDARDLWIVVPSRVWIEPGESRSQNVTVLTPRGKLYEFGRSATISILVEGTPVTGGSGATIPRAGVLQIHGAYIPAQWAPVIIVGLIAGAITTRHVALRLRRSREERGAPHPVELTPRQRVLLEELRRSDPAAYKERRAQLAAVYAARKERYRTEHKAQLARDREEHKVASAEYRVARKRQAAQRKEDKRNAKVAKRQAARQAKVERRGLKQREKALVKKRKLLGKEQKRQAKLDAKQAKRDAKAQAKADQARAKAQAKADQARAKAEKAAAREARKAEKAARKGPPPDKP